MKALKRAQGIFLMALHQKLPRRFRDEPDDRGYDNGDDVIENVGNLPRPVIAQSRSPTADGIDDDTTKMREH